jgi:hypothetical protein
VWSCRRVIKFLLLLSAYRRDFHNSETIIDYKLHLPKSKQDFVVSCMNMLRAVQ